MNIILVGPQEFGFPRMEFPKALEFLNGLDVIDFDTENDIPTQELICMQLGNSETQIIFTENFIKLKPLLETKTLRIQNALHDLRFLYRLGIYPRFIRDTFLQEMILECGKQTLGPSLKAAGLFSLVQKYCNITLDKNPRKNPTLTKEFLEYAAKDIMFLERIDRQQRKIAESLDLMPTFDLENQYVRPLAYITNCGFKLNVEGFKEKVKKDILELKQTEEELKQIILSEPKLKKFVHWVSDLFSTPIQELTFNWTQPKMVLEVFRTLGFVWSEKEKETIDIRLMVKSEGQHPLIDAYIKAAKLSKKVSSFGQNILDAVDIENRIRSNYIQIIATGRQSSRGETEDSDLKGINLQNIPKWGEERKYFTCDKGNVLVIGDYAGQETRILAEFARDPNYAAYISHPEKDLHCFMAQCVWPKYRIYSHSYIKENFPKVRNDAKPGTFSIPYGGDGPTIAKNLNIDIEEGKRAYNEFMSEFKGLTRYFDHVTTQALKLGFILVNPVTKRKIFLKDFTTYRELKFIKNQTASQWKFCKSYENKQGRLARNYPIQGTGSDQLKTAIIYLFDLLLKNNLLNIVKIVNIVHDEIDIECPERLAPKVKVALDNCMVAAGKKYLKKIPVKVDIRVSKYWKE